MSQQRKTEPSGGASDSERTSENERTAANAIDEARILDATYDLLLSVGIRRMTMADIARHAEISRATLYRRWPNVQAVVAAVVTREFAAVGADTIVRAAGESTRDQLVNGVVRIVQVAREHPMLRKIIELDPEFLMPYLVTRTGRTTIAQLELLDGVIRAGIKDGSIRKDDVEALAQAVLLTAWSFTITGPVIAGRTSTPTLDNQLRLLLDRYLTP
jgi:AcrR family transcriptional regulator